MGSGNAVSAKLGMLGLTWKTSISQNLGQENPDVGVVKELARCDELEGELEISHCRPVPDADEESWSEVMR